MDSFINLFIDLLDEKPIIPVNGETVFKELPQWDSLLALSLIVMISNEYGKSVDGEIIRKKKTLKELFEVIND